MGKNKYYFQRAWRKIQKAVTTDGISNYTTVVKNVQELNNVHIKEESVDNIYKYLEYIPEGFDSNNQLNLTLKFKNVAMAAEMKTIWNFLEEIQSRQNTHQKQGNQQNARIDQQKKIQTTKNN